MSVEMSLEDDQPTKVRYGHWDDDPTSPTYGRRWILDDAPPDEPVIVKGPPHA